MTDKRFYTLIKILSAILIAPTLVATIIAIIVLAVVSIQFSEPNAPEATIAPETTAVPETTIVPETTKVPETTAVPEITIAPETTAVPETTLAPETTTAPETKWVIQLTPDEYQDFALILGGEARDMSLEALVATAATIINRIQSPQFPNTFYGVIFEKDQFETVSNGKIKDDWVKVEGKIPQKVFDALDIALTGVDPAEEWLREEALRLGLDPEEYAEGGAFYFYDIRYMGESELAKRELNPVRVQADFHVFHKTWKTK